MMWQGVSQIYVPANSVAMYDGGDVGFDASVSYQYGVDLNRNFGYEWGYDDIGSSPSSSSETYRGTGPFSEPETQNVKAFIESHEFVITVFYHSYSNLFLYPWGFGPKATPDASLIQQVGSQYATPASYTLLSSLGSFSKSKSWRQFPTA